METDLSITTATTLLKRSIAVSPVDVVGCFNRFHVKEMDLDGKTVNLHAEILVCGLMTVVPTTIGGAWVCMV